MPFLCCTFSSVAFNGGMNVELTAPILWKNAPKQIAYGAVLVPNEPDTDGDILTAEKIAEVAHGWLADYSNIDLQHSLNNVNARPVESYITQTDSEVTIKGVKSVLPAGTWVMAVRIDDSKVWQDVVSGKLSGYSIMGVRRNSATKNKSDEIALKRTMLKDLGADWVCPFVSLVDEPAVPKAKFFAIKAVEKKAESFFDKLFSGIGSKGIEPDSKKNKGDKVNEKEVQALVVKSVSEALKNAEAEKVAEAEAVAKKQAELDEARKQAEEAAKKEMQEKIDAQKEEHEKAIKELGDKMKELTEQLTTKSRKLDVDPDDGGEGNTETFKSRFPRDQMGRRIYK